MNRKGHLCMARVAATALVAFVAVQTLLLAFPAAYPRVLVKTLKGISPWLDEDTTLLEVSMKGTEGHFLIENRKLGHFVDVDGKSGPAVRLDYTFELGVYNIYPLIILTILASMPLNIRGRLFLLAAGFAGIFLVGLFDLAIIWYWMGVEGRSLALSGTGFRIAPTAENQAALHEAARWVDPITLAKSFLSTGGRQFLSVLVVGICLLVVYPCPKVD